MRKPDETSTRQFNAGCSFFICYHNLLMNPPSRKPMKSIFISAVSMALLASCASIATSIADIKKRPATLTLSTDASIENFHRCLDRWFDEVGIYSTSARFEEYIVSIGTQPQAVITLVNDKIQVQDAGHLVSIHNYGSPVRSCADDTRSSPSGL